MNRCAVVALLMLLVATRVSALDLKGIEVGRAWDFDQISQQLAGMKCSREPMPACEPQLVPIVGAQMMVYVQLRGSETVRISADFDSAYYVRLAEGLVQKFGRPAHISHSKVQTQGGAQLDQVMMSWQNAAGDDMQLFRYADANGGELVLRSASQIKLEAAIAAKAKEDL